MTSFQSKVIGGSTVTPISGSSGGGASGTVDSTVKMSSKVLVPSLADTVWSPDLLIGTLKVAIKIPWSVAVAVDTSSSSYLTVTFALASKPVPLTMRSVPMLPVVVGLRLPEVDGGGGGGGVDGVGGGGGGSG